MFVLVNLEHISDYWKLARFKLAKRLKILCVMRVLAWRGVDEEIGLDRGLAASLIQRREVLFLPRNCARHCDRQYGRYRRVYEPWISIDDATIRVRAHYVVGCRRCRGDLRRAVLRRAWRCAASVRRGV